MPWIIEAGELRLSIRNGFVPSDIIPQRDFLWATTNPEGDRTSAPMRPGNRELYHQGGVQLIRFTLPGDGFIPWRDIPKVAPEWTPDLVAELEKAAPDYGETGFEKWRCRSDPLPLTQVLAVDAKSIASGEERTIESGSWKPIKATPEFCIKFPDDPMCRGFAIGRVAYCATQCRDQDGSPSYRNAFLVVTFS